MKKMIFLGMILVVSSAGQVLAGSGQAAVKKPPSPGMPATEDPAYIIGAEDVLEIGVWKEPDISRNVPVRPDGKISLPLLNDVQASGLTPIQLQEKITEGLKKYITDPRVTVIVTQINSRRVFVMGEVLRPGPQYMIPDMTVLQALAAAGGFSQFAKLTKIYVLRNDKGRQLTFPFNYKEVIRGYRGQQNLLLKPGDTIVVP